MRFICLRCPLKAVCLSVNRGPNTWASHLTSLCLSFSIHKMVIIVATTMKYCEDYMGWCMPSTETALWHALALLAVLVNWIQVSSLQTQTPVAPAQLSSQGQRWDQHFLSFLQQDAAAFEAHCISFAYKVTAFSPFSLSLPSDFHFFCDMVKVLDIISC